MLLKKLQVILKSHFYPPVCHHTSVLIAIDKSTPHRDTNQAIVLIVPSDGKRVAVPVDAPIVYSVSPDSAVIQGGDHDELARQVISVLSQKLEMDEKQLRFLRGLFPQSDSF